jgi:hypothetical protein
MAGGEEAKGAPMTENQNTTQTQPADESAFEAGTLAAEDARILLAMFGEAEPQQPQEPREPFVPGYTPTQGMRVHRQRLSADEGGVATATFHGDVRSAWVQTGATGRMSLYAEVNVLDTDDTTFRVAMVPTGKRVPMNASRIGSAGRMHAYLLETTRTACGPHGRPQPDETVAQSDGDTDAQSDGDTDAQSDGGDATQTEA